MIENILTVGVTIFFVHTLIVWLKMAKRANKVIDEFEEISRSEFEELENKNAERKSEHNIKMKQMEEDFKKQDSRVSEKINFREGMR